jgi:hypothetical protein
MRIDYVEIGVCGLSCRLCPAFHRETKSRCPGCKSEFRMAAACPFINCAIKRKGIEFCWLCSEAENCDRLKRNREFAKLHDTDTCYQTIGENALFMRKNGVAEFEKQQKTREQLLKAMLAEFNEGRSKTRFCVAATVMEIGELEAILEAAREKAKGLDLKAKAELMHALLDEVSKQRGYVLKLRK